MTRIRRTVRRAILLAVVAAAALSGGARADQIHAALTEQQISIDRSFSGARIILFGTITETENFDAENRDLIVSVRGPSEDFVIREKRRVAGVWLAGDAVTARNAPSFFFVGATRPIDEIINAEQRRRRQLGADHLRVNFVDLPTAVDDDKIRNPSEIFELYRSALIDAMARNDRYVENSEAVSFVDGNLFRVIIDLPADTSVGFYRVNIYFVKDGQIAAWKDAPLYVSKVGLERLIFDLAHRFPLLYGLLCVALSLTAGWIAAAIFRT